MNLTVCGVNTPLLPGHHVSVMQTMEVCNLQVAIRDSKATELCPYTCIFLKIADQVFSVSCMFTGFELLLHVRLQMTVWVMALWFARIFLVFFFGVSQYTYIYIVFQPVQLWKHVEFTCILLIVSFRCAKFRRQGAIIQLPTMMSWPTWRCSWVHMHGSWPRLRRQDVSSGGEVHMHWEMWMLEVILFKGVSRCHILRPLKMTHGQFCTHNFRFRDWGTYGLHNYHLEYLRINIAPETLGLEYQFPFGKAPVLC